tara:strand:+ start:2424 stop:3251 length:828 start_codon:yes stop_codon:yes gene_type:complete
MALPNPPSSIRVAAVQMSSGQNIDVNLKMAAELIQEGAKLGAQWVALPEMFAYIRQEGEPFPCAQTLGDEIVEFIKERARLHQIWILGGSFPELAEDSRVYNTSFLVDPKGDLAGIYRKMHLFDVNLKLQGGISYKESKSIAPGKSPVCVSTPFGKVGLSVCYDLRFPELYRNYMAEGARFLAVPSAFAPETGRAHWEILLRGRAIENQCFVIAPAQSGAHSPTRSSYGHTLLIDPWGSVLAKATRQEEVIVADLNLQAQTQIRESLPCLKNRRL